MEEYKCAFSNTLVTGQFGCEKAEQVTRRGGPDVVCSSDQAHQECEKLFQRMKQAALPAFGVEDDLLSMPHSVLVKIQFGGLLGLHRLQGNGTDESAVVKNIHGLVGQAIGKHGGLDAIPCQAFVEDMTSYKLKRRR
ncbi:hypothetical protein [Sulfuricaulis sp.]|jgi:hypothetical protein|uniref:hypothetical protein n=1 Tax=Sulfuricaulis sp. TaxID=2003553 RepID=UPI0035594A87